MPLRTLRRRKQDGLVLAKRALAYSGRNVEYGDDTWTLLSRLGRAHGFDDPTVAVLSLALAARCVELPLLTRDGKVPSVELRRHAPLLRVAAITAVTSVKDGPDGKPSVQWADPHLPSLLQDHSHVPPPCSPLLPPLATMPAASRPP